MRCGRHKGLESSIPPLMGHYPSFKTISNASLGHNSAVVSKKPGAVFGLLWLMEWFSNHLLASFCGPQPVLGAPAVSVNETVPNTCVPEADILVRVFLGILHSEGLWCTFSFCLSFREVERRLTVSRTLQKEFGFMFRGFRCTFTHSSVSTELH